MKHIFYTLMILMFVASNSAQAGIFGSSVRSGVRPLKLAKAEAEMSEQGKMRSSEGKMKAAEKSGKDEIQICPVLGTRFKKSQGIKVKIDGKTHYVCCPVCAAKLKADPEKYLHKDDEGMK